MYQMQGRLSLRRAKGGTIFWCKFLLHFWAIWENDPFSKSEKVPGLKPRLPRLVRRPWFYTTVRVHAFRSAIRFILLKTEKKYYWKLTINVHEKEKATTWFFLSEQWQINVMCHVTIHRSFFISTMLRTIFHFCLPKK